MKAVIPRCLVWTLSFHLIPVWSHKTWRNAFEIAEMIAAHDPLAIKVEMESYYRGRDLPRDQALALSGFMFRMIRSTFPEKPPLEDEK